MFGYMALKKQIMDKQIELDKLSLTLQNKEQEQQIQLSRIKADLERDSLDLHSKLKREHDSKLEELSLAKQRSVDELKAEHQKELLEVKSEAQKEIFQEKESVVKEFYTKMSTELTKLHSEGNVNTKFVQDLALTMMDKNPAQKQALSIEHIQTKKDQTND